MRTNLPARIAAIDAWLTEVGADRAMTYVSYNNEIDMPAGPSTGNTLTWDGQPGSLDPDGEHFHREAAFLELVVSRLKCLPAFGNDASPVTLLRRLPRRLEIFDAWGVKPAALVYHGYGFGGHTAKHLGIMLSVARAAGFRGRLIGGEVARRVDTSAGNQTDRDASGEWWRQYADEVEHHSDVWACYFFVYQVTSVA